MTTTADADLWSAMWSYKDHGKSWDAVQRPPGRGYRWLHESFGTNGRMLEVQAIIGRMQLARMTETTRRRRANAERIWEEARECPGLRVPAIPEWAEHGAYRAYVFVEPAALKASWSRDRIVDEIVEMGVPCYTGSCSEIYLEKAFDGTPWRPADRLAVAKELGETSLMFLVHPTLEAEHLDQTGEALRGVMRRAVR